MFPARERTGTYRLGYDALDGDIHNLAFADPYPEAFDVPSRRLGPRSIYGGGAPVSPTNMPIKMRVSGRRKQLGDFASAYHICFVSRRFVEVVERFQTSIQCFPVECVFAKNTPTEERYFFFTTVLLDAVVREKTTATWKQLPPDRGFWRPELHAGQTFVFDKSRLGDNHMWVDPNMPGLGALISDALYTALQEAKIDSFYESSGFAEI